MNGELWRGDHWEIRVHQAVLSECAGHSTASRFLLCTSCFIHSPWFLFWPGQFLGLCLIPWAHLIVSWLTVSWRLYFQELGVECKGLMRQNFCWPFDRRWHCCLTQRQIIWLAGAVFGDGLGSPWVPLRHWAEISFSPACVSPVVVGMWTSSVFVLSVLVGKLFCNEALSTAEVLCGSP